MTSTLMRDGGCSTAGGGAVLRFGGSGAPAVVAAAVDDAALTLLTPGEDGAEGVELALLPPTEMLPAFTTTAAEILRLPDTRMPASPASMVPMGAMRSTSLGFTPATAARTPIPPPVARPARSVCTSALCGSMSTRVGGADWTVLEDEPAA